MGSISFGGSGLSRVSGFIGPTGYTGYSGYTGYTGAPGTASATGSTGYTGYTGFGQTGYTGYTGYTGAASTVAGPTGYTGYTGAGSPKRAFGSSFDGGGAELTSGLTSYLTIPCAMTIVAWNILVDTGTCTVKLWRVASGTAIPTETNSINANGLSLASGTAIRSTTLTDFTDTTLDENDIVAINLVAVSGATKVVVVIEAEV